MERVPLLFPGSYSLNAWDVIIVISKAHGLEGHDEPRRRKEDAIEAPMAITPEIFGKMAAWRWPSDYPNETVPGTTEDLFHSLRLSLLNCLDHIRGKADLLERCGFALEDVYDFVFGGVVLTTVEGGPVRLLAAMAPDASGKCRCFIVDAEIEFRT